MEGYFIGKTGRDWHVTKLGPHGPERVLTGTLVAVVNFMAGVTGEEPVLALAPRFNVYAVHARSGERTLVGEAAAAPDGGINVELRALPLSADGRLQLAPE